MNKSFLPVLSKVAAAVFILEAGWHLFQRSEHLLFMNSIQTGLLFLILAAVLDKKTTNT